jgi:hypothetical protein
LTLINLYFILSCPIWKKSYKFIPKNFIQKRRF